MPIQFACPNCGKVLTAPDSAAGVTGPCPQCHTQVTAPAASTPPPGAMPSPSAGPLNPPVSPAPPSYAPLASSPMGSPAYLSKTLPPELQGLNWGAFFLTWIWGIAHSVWLSLLCFIPIANVVMPFVLLFKGNEWAWQNRQFSSLEEFRQVQSAWMKWGLILFVLGIVFGIIATIALLGMMSHAMRTSPGGFPPSSSGYN